jgi:predicted nucleic acid-binding Zn ribbon protein
MQRASRLIGHLNSAAPSISGEQIACTAWPRAVGKNIAAHTRAAKLVRKNLVIEVEDVVWQRNLFSLSRHILSNLEKNIGAGIVAELEFRIVPPRREPQRAAASAANVSRDEADGIADPVLRNLYKAARKRELA